MAEQADLLSPVPGYVAPQSVSAQPAVPVALWCGIAILTAAGCLGIYRELFILWYQWTTDPLRSIGLLIPPASIVLSLRLWRRLGWQMRGTWWGLLVIAASYFLSALRENSILSGIAGTVAVSFIPLSLPLYVYGSGVVLLFAGTRVWRQAWFPLGLLLLSQPVPIISNGLIDEPLQHISASVARRFATMIGLVPTTPELRLMFSPDFGMFIAPGCDGIRGAVAMGYVALILGYLKRVSLYRWAAYVCGAVLLGYLFNFIRLCVLVLYYRAALGHPTFEGLAKQADYVIGSCLFLVAALLLFWLARRTESRPAAQDSLPVSAGLPPPTGSLLVKCGAFAAVLIAALAIPSSALMERLKAVPSPESLSARMPKQIGGFALNRTWYEQDAGAIVVEDGAYSQPGSDEIILGVWVAPLRYLHDARHCWLARGLEPDVFTSRSFVTAGGASVPTGTGFYSDGVTESIVVNAICSPGSCSQFQNLTSSGRIGFLFLKPQTGDLTGSGSHPVSIMLRINRLHSNTPKADTYSQLSDEAQSFLAGLDLKGLSRAFQ